MRVTFLFSGLPHYLITLLNRLASVYGMDVSLVIPRERGISLGEGIRLADTGSSYKFSIHFLEEYQGKLDKPYFRDLHLTLLDISPDILVIGWPYIINFYFDRRSRNILRRNNISLVYREIPFDVAPKNQAMKYYRNHPVLDENLEVKNPSGLKFYLWAFALNQLRIRYYRLADATMIYASHGFPIHESFGVAGEKIFLTYNSPDTALIADTRKRLKNEGMPAPDPNRIIHVGRLVKWKRVDLLVEATAILAGRHEAIELCIIGTGPEEHNLRELAQKKAAGAVKFLGAIYDPEQLAREFMASGIYVLAGMGGLSINEAMAYGKPVICSRCDGTEKDLVKDGFNGFFFKEGDVADLAAKIEVLLDDPDLCRTMGENSLSVIEERINIESVTKRFHDCFEYLRPSSETG
jgi:glycosyltransferase involved in cell wall biosynthesis